MAGSTDSDPLAETAAADGSDTGARPAINATATGVPSEPRGLPLAPGEAPKTIGRYQIEGQLGQGAMGVVYAAHDPDLERRIALKVLRSHDSEAARARLLREARAMARLSHPAVVTVHEVGTAGGVDYVAMELIDGTTLHEWIATAKPTQLDVLDAFDTAGRGLAAAHAAGLVHRDFKPHNVLRSRRGRVVVTDFGLARAALEEPDQVATVPGTGPRRDASSDAGSLSSTLTATGALLGTPAYMAPEQHDGSGVGAAADQFSYCVALWEALTGARPFPGQTLATVRQQIERGPEPASEAKIPRRLRPILRRGLAVDPDARFPTMDALLAAVRKRTGRLWAFLLASAVVAAAVVVLIIVRTRPAVVAALPGCGRAETELAAFLHAPGRATLAASAEGKAHVAALDALGRDWIEAQRAVCANTSDPGHARRVTCLRAVRGHLETALTATAALDPDELIEADPVLLASDPRACTAPGGAPARIETPPADQAQYLALAMGQLGRKARREAVPDPGVAKPCLRTSWLLGKLADFESLPHAEAVSRVAEASEAADRCGDDRLAASVTLIALSTDMSRLMQDPGQARRVASVIERAGGDRMLAVIAGLIDGVMASFRHDMDRGIERVSAATDAGLALGLRRFTIQTSSMVASWKFQRGGPGDVDDAVRRARSALALAGPDHKTSLQRLLITILAFQGKFDEAAVVAAEIDDRGEQDAVPGSIAVTGRVVDEAGAPVAGARVVAQRHIIIYPKLFDPTSPSISTAITAADGTFTIASAPPRALVMAAKGDRVTRPVPLAAKVALTLAPTSSVHGTVTGGVGLGRIEVAVEPMPAPFDGVDFTAPIAADGSWRIDGVIHGKAKVVVVSGSDEREVLFKDIVVGANEVGPVPLDVAQSGVPIHIILRNQVQAPITIGIVLVIRGKFTGKVLGDVEQLRTGLTQSRAFPVPTGEEPAAMRGKVESGDVITQMTSVEPGEVTVCGLGITGELSDASYMRRIDRHVREMAIECKQVTITTADQVIMVEVPPMQRLPEE